MSPDDPRHGTRRGYYAHRRDDETACDDCKRAAAAAEARYEVARITGKVGRVPAIGTKRRLRALQALGWTLTEIAEQIGSKRSRVEKWCSEERTYVYTTTAVRVADVYDRLCMGTPTGTWATRTRNMARRKGYAPPLAWDDIDDPNEEPSGLGYVEPTRAELVAEYVERGDNLTDATRALGIDKNALQTWCRRNGMRDEYLTLATREGYWNPAGRDVA